MTLINRCPLVVAAALMMDCSGGNVYTETDTLTGNMEKLDADLLIAAERELAKLTGEQIEWLALGGPEGDGPEGDESVYIDMETVKNADRVLGALYNA